MTTSSHVSGTWSKMMFFQLCVFRLHQLPGDILCCKGHKDQVPLSGWTVFSCWPPSLPPMGFKKPWRHYTFPEMLSETRDQMCHLPAAQFSSHFWVTYQPSVPVTWAFVVVAAAKARTSALLLLMPRFCSCTLDRVSEQLTVAWANMRSFGSKSSWVLLGRFKLFPATEEITSQQLYCKSHSNPRAHGISRRLRRVNEAGRESVRKSGITSCHDDELKKSEER